jgi:hypothetical protein
MRDAPNPIPTAPRITPQQAFADQQRLLGERD